MGLQNLRIAFLAGNLVQAGAEKQLYYMVRALKQAGAEVRVYNLIQGQHYEPLLTELGVTPIWFGQADSPAIRLVRLTNHLRQFRPHIVQAATFFMNIYAGCAGRFCRALAIGSSRSDVYYEIECDRRWAHGLLHTPQTFIVNSEAAKKALQGYGISPEAIALLANAIDITEFDKSGRLAKPPIAPKSPVVVAVGRLVPVKRHDRFITALARARELTPSLRGCIIGEGPERSSLEAMAQQYKLHAPAIEFLGERSDVAKLLREATMMALTSEHEGFPNVVLEAMAARLPVVTTPAGDAGSIVLDGVTGYVVDFTDTEVMAQRMVQLAHSCELRQSLGEAGRKRVEHFYSHEKLAERLIEIYRQLAAHTHHSALGQILSGSDSTL